MGQVTFQCEAGALIRGQIRRAVKSYAWNRGFKLEVDEDKGFLGSLLRFTLEVPDNLVQQTYSELESWQKSLKIDSSTN